jgi:hypothetical protein
MPYRHVVKVSEPVYEMLQELAKRLNAESPNQALEMLLKGVHGVTPSPIRVEEREDPFWLDIVVGEGYDAEHIALNRIQYEKLCRAGLLPPAICTNKQTP